MPTFCLFFGKKLKINSDKAILIWVRMYRKMVFRFNFLVDESTIYLYFLG